MSAFFEDNFFLFLSQVGNSKVHPISIPKGNAHSKKNDKCNLLEYLAEGPQITPFCFSISVFLPDGPEAIGCWRVISHHKSHNNT